VPPLVALPPAGRHRRKAILGVVALALLAVVATAPPAGATPRPDPFPSPAAATSVSAPPQDWIALTFDDGPVPGTYAILDILDRYGAKATFFISAWRLPANAEIAREIIRRGHSLQTHGWLHRNWTGLSSGAVQRDIEKSIQLIYEATGYRPTCIRPPFGATSPRTTAIAESLGLEVVIWNANSADYAHQSSAALLRAAPTWQPGSVVLAHDTNHYIWTPVLAEIIEGLQGRGLELVSMCGYQRTPRALFIPR